MHQLLFQYNPFKYPYQLIIMLKVIIKLTLNVQNLYKQLNFYFYNHLIFILKIYVFNLLIF